MFTAALVIMIVLLIVVIFIQWGSSDTELSRSWDDGYNRGYNHAISMHNKKPKGKAAPNKLRRVAAL